MTRTTVASLPFNSTMYQLYDIMAMIEHLNPSFHPVPTSQTVHVKVNEDKVDEAKKIFRENINPRHIPVRRGSTYP